VLGHAGQLVGQGVEGLSGIKLVFPGSGVDDLLCVDEEVRGQLAMRFEVLLPHLNERQQRLALACEARLLGHGA
jgi:hypothetical protein